MEAATPLNPPRVALVGDRLRVEHLTIADECAVRLAGEREGAGEDLADVVTQAIEIGARVLDREQAAANTEYVKAEFERQAREVETQFAERASAVSTELTERIEAAFGAEAGLVPKLLDKHFGDESTTAVQNRVKALVDDLLRGHREALAKQFTAADESNPLAQFQAASVRAIKHASDQQAEGLRAMNETIVALRAEVASLKAEQEKLEAVAEEAERGTAKGRTYEEQVADAIAAIAHGRGDCSEAVGDRGESGGRKGDVVVDLDAQAGPPKGRVVFEVKTSRLSNPDAVRELDAAMAGRSAGYGVLVVPAEEKVPAKMRPLQELHGNKLVVTYDPENGGPLSLETGYALARARVLMARSTRGDVDAAAIEEAAERAIELLGQVKAIKASLTGAKTHIDRGAEAVETMSRAVREQLDEVCALARVGDDAEPPAADEHVAPDAASDAGAPAAAPIAAGASAPQRTHGDEAGREPQGALDV
jgi:hypothetical protein